MGSLSLVGKVLTEDGVLETWMEVGKPAPLGWGRRRCQDNEKLTGRMTSDPHREDGAGLNVDASLLGSGNQVYQGTIKGGVGEELGTR